MSELIKPRCPMCKREGVKVGPDTYRCPSGHGFFDADPNEGSDVCSDPSKRIERQDEERARKVKRLGGRR